MMCTKWFESIDDVNIRKVETLAKWLEKQTNIRKIALLASSNGFPYPSECKHLFNEKDPVWYGNLYYQLNNYGMRTL